MSAVDWNHQECHACGIRIHYVRHGEGTPLVLLHGWPEFWYVWHKIIPSLAERFDVIVPDLRGFGDSDKPAGPLAVEDLVDDLEAFVDDLGLDRFGLVTHDVGAWIGRRLARRIADRMIGLFLFDCPYPGIGSRAAAPGNLKEIWYQSFHREDWAADLIGSSREACRIYFGNFLAHWAHDAHAFDDDLEIWVDNFMKPGNLQGGFNWYSAIHEERLQSALGIAAKKPLVTVPTRIVWGASDPVIKAEWSDRLDEYFSDFDLTIMDGVGHFPHYEDPEMANREIITFFDKLLRT